MNSFHLKLWYILLYFCYREVTSRKDRTWIITGAHRPMYCSTLDGDDCDKRESILRPSSVHLITGSAVSFQSLHTVVDSKGS